MSQPHPLPSPSAGPSGPVDLTSPAMQGGEQPTRTPSRMSLSALVNSPPAHTLASISNSAPMIPSTSQDRTTIPTSGHMERYPSPTRSTRSIDPSQQSSHSRASATPSRLSPHPLPLSAQSHSSHPHSRISPSYISPRGFPQAPQYVSPVETIEDRARSLEGYRDEYGQIRPIPDLPGHRSRTHGIHEDLRVDPYATALYGSRGMDHRDRQRERYAHSRGRSSPTKVHPPPLDPSYHTDGVVPALNGRSHHVAESSRNVRRMMPSLALAGSEGIWESTLGMYQAQREAEVDQIVLIHRENPRGLSPIKREGHRREEYGPASTNGDALLDDSKAKRKAPRKRPVKQEATVEDELLGLADTGGSSLPPSDAIDPEDEDFGPATIVQPSGLTRAHLIAKVEANDLTGLTEQDVKAVQDEVWERQMNRQGAQAPTRKDGSLRRKPGPAKGWKKLRTGETMTEGYADQVADRRGSSVRDGDSEFGDYGSVMDDDLNGEADAEIAALLSGQGTRKGKSRSKRRREDDGEDRYAEYSDDGYDYGYGDPDGRNLDDDLLSMADDPYGARKGSRKSLGGARPRVRTRPSHNDMRQAEEEILGLAGNVNDYEDPRGVSEVEAKARHGMVEELQKQVWQVIVRDIPRVYRVYQAHDTAVKTDCSRTAQACMRNAFSQRAMKPTFKSVARINKDTISKSRRVVKEMLLYWRKNEKDELAARKKAEKEALDRAKAEEEARESKRQARKLNFLLTQTELYSHFIGKKIKTAEAEGGDGEVTPAREGEEQKMVERDELLAKGEIGLGADGQPLADLDYDDDDDEALRRHAARGAHAAVQAAREKAKAFDDARGGAQPVLDLDGDELNFQNPTLAEDSVTITQPKMLMAQLKEYQLKGLTWLGNLYEQGINGILADEMGLGKTIQSISLLAYLAEHHNLWGPFLVIAPASTLHNWQQELARFVPRLKALPYWGSPKDRETLRKIWSRKNMTFTEDSPFHILVTSYQLAVQDEKYFHATRWQYMILDEAQAIKSSSSARWKSLLSLHCRNRLLLTGTPIQNSMQELWALLHFIMPSLFDSHEEFSEWFSKDIENAAGGGSGSLQPEQLRRLHMILKPFMLRRVKKHVQKELGDKIEIDLLVDLSQRQRSIYKALRQRVSIADLIAQANNLTDSLGAKNLMNLVMQFRKVCNHPDLFERADVVSPYVFGTFSQSGPFSREGDQLYCPDSLRNLIEVRLPKIIWTDGGKLDRPMESGIGADTRYVHGLMNIWNAEWINKEEKTGDGEFGFLRLLDISPGQAAVRAKSHPLVNLLHRSEEDAEVEQQGDLENDPTFAASSRLPFAPVAPAVPSTSLHSGLTALTDITNQSWHDSFLSRREARFAIQPAVTTYIKPVISDRSYLNSEDRVFSDPIITKALYGATPSERNDIRATNELALIVPGVKPHGLISDSLAQTPWSTLQIPPPKRLIVDSAKLARLDDLLRELKAQGHRVLLYFQMTKMMDLVEEYLVYRQYKYLRLDGSSPIGERRDMVTNFQTNPDYFIFCLSTRAGGLGINLTAADTVIFYDHDWNPSNDAQAMDRAHRVGQTKQVTVYRLIARGTIEERILKLARAKKDVQDIVVGTKSLTDVAKPSEIVSLFMDDEELAESVAKRKQAEAHGYIAPTSIAPKPRSRFGDTLGGMDDDEDDFFSLTKRPANGEDEDFGDEAQGGPGANGVNGGTKKTKKRKADGDTPKKTKKKVKIALGPDGLPL